MLAPHFFISLLVLLVVSWNPGSESETYSSSGPPHLDELWDLHEEFEYEVRYGFMNLGTVEVETHTRDTTYNGKTARKFTNIIKSNPRVPVVGRREVHYHTMLTRNDTIPYGLRFWSDNYHDDIMEEYLYEFDYDEGEATYYVEGEKKSVSELNEPADGGPAIFYYSRLHAGTSRNIQYPIYIDEDTGFVEINNQSSVNSYDSKAFDGKVDSYRATGNANFDGPFGFSGDFEAIFKADELRIPLEAKVKVWVGNVTVRLTDYKRHQ